MKSLESYKMSTGYYDIAQIRIDAGESERAARFDAIFGGHKTSDDFSPVAPRALPGDWQALFEEATTLNNEMLAATEAAEIIEAIDILSLPENELSNAQLERLIALGYAQRNSVVTETDESEIVVLVLNARGQELAATLAASRCTRTRPAETLTDQDVLAADYAECVAHNAKIENCTPNEYIRTFATCEYLAECRARYACGVELLKRYSVIRSTEYLCVPPSSFAAPPYSPVVVVPAGFTNHNQMYRKIALRKRNARTLQH